MNILGISGLSKSVSFKKRELPLLSPQSYRIAQGFDSAAALLSDGEVKAAAAEERFSLEKATGEFPVNAIHYCLQSASIDVGNVDYIAHNFDYEPFRSFYDQDEFTKKQFDEVYSREAQLHCLQSHFPSFEAKNFIQVPHHLAHAASAFYVSGFDEALILVADGMGEMHSMTVAVGRKNSIEIINQITSLNSLGILYGVFTLYLGFQFGLDEYKVMGLAPFGNPQRYYQQFMKYIQFSEDGRFTIPILFANKTTEEKETYSQTLRLISNEYGPSRHPEAEITQDHKDIAAALQAVLQTSLLRVLQHYKNETKQSNLCMAGGVALNCTANGVIKRSRMFKNMFVQPASGDDGTALGAALYLQKMLNPKVDFQKMELPLWGPEYSNEEISKIIQGRTDCKSTFYESFDMLITDVAQWIEKGQIVAWFQGRMEFGPRALGNRSILADPHHPGMRDRINKLVKKREGFRPFAPAVTIEAASKYFEVSEKDEALYAYMLCVAPVKQAYREQLPAITHVDGSARLQTVSKDGNPRFWALLNEFGKLSGMPILLNTSFNVRGQPIVCTPTEAIDTFFLAGLDVLVLGNFVISQKDTQFGI